VTRILPPNGPASRPLTTGRLSYLGRQSF